MNSPVQDTRCWDQYWLTGRRSCCDEQRDSADAAVVARRWEAFLADLGHGRVLDLCTGNGAVPRLAVESGTLQVRDIEYFGIDSASIAPAGDDPLRNSPGVYFLRGSALRMPFPDRVFDALTSQFGIEYLPAERMVPEAMRVLRPGGKALFLTHARAGITATTARAELDDIAELLESIGIFASARRALLSVCGVEHAAGPPSDADVEAAMKARDEFQAGLRQLADTWQQRTASAVFRDSGSILQHTYRYRAAFPLETLLDKVGESEQSVLLHRERLRQLVGAALDQPRCEVLLSLLREHGAASANAEPVMTADGEQQLGWAISVTRE